MNPLGLSAEALAERKKRIHAGDAELIMDGHWSLLYRIKAGLEDEADFYDGLSWHVKRHVSREQMDLRRQLGLFTEPFNLAWCEQQTRRAITYFSDDPLLRQAWSRLRATDLTSQSFGVSDMELQVSRDYPFMACNLDAMTTTPQGEPMVLDAKMLSRASDVETLRYTAAGTHQATVMGADFWGLSIIAGGKWGLVIQPVDPLYQARLIAAEREFWGYVERGEEPADRAEPTLPPKPQPKLREVIVPTGNPEMLELLYRQNNWLPGVVEEVPKFIATEAAAKAHAVAREAIKEALPEDVGLVRMGRFKASRSKANAITMTVDKLEEDNG